jgi:hypothetical protein
MLGNLADFHTDLILTPKLAVWSKYSCSFQMVIFQEPTQAFFTADGAAAMINRSRGGWK